MILKDYFSYDDKESILAQLQDLQAEWGAISFLLSLLKDGTFHEKLGKGSLYLLLDDEKLTSGKSTLASFASFCDKDEIESELKPWIGFVFTSPSYRGRHLAGKIIAHCMKIAGALYPESEYVYVSSEEKGLYEKYGFEPFERSKSVWDDDTVIFRKKIIRVCIKSQNLELVPQNLCYFKSTHEYASDRKKMRFMINLPNESEAETKDFLKGAETEWKKEKPGFYEFAILKEENHIGGISLYLDNERKTGELGRCLAKEAQGKGYAFEAAKALVCWAKTELSVARFVAHCDSENIASWKTMEKLGMKRISSTGGRFNKIAPTEERKEFLYEM